MSAEVPIQNCGFCGDPIPDPPHICWLARHYSLQETIEPEPASEFLEIGKLEADVMLPARMRTVDLSSI